MLFRKCQVTTLLTPGRGLQWHLHCSISCPRTKETWAWRKGKVPRARTSLHQFAACLSSSANTSYLHHSGNGEDLNIKRLYLTIHQLPSRLSVFSIQEETFNIGCILWQKRILSLQQHQLLQLLGDLSSWETREVSIASYALLFHLYTKNTACFASFLAFLLCTMTTFN